MRRRGASHESALTGRRLLAGGVTALTVTFAFVAANAIWYQPHAHKAPILSTRTAHLPAAPQTRPANETAVADTRTASDDEEVTLTPGAATRLAFGQQPTNTEPGQDIAPPITVRIEDANGNLIGRHRSTGITKPNFTEKARYYNEEGSLVEALERANVEQHEMLR